jgi:hypothetical protein
MKANLGSVLEGCELPLDRCNKKLLLKKHVDVSIRVLTSPDQLSELLPRWYQFNGKPADWNCRRASPISFTSLFPHPHLVKPEQFERIVQLRESFGAKSPRLSISLS